MMTLLIDKRMAADAGRRTLQRRIGAVLLATAIAIISAVVAPAQAVTTLVKNTGKSSDRIANLSAFQDGLAVFGGRATGTPYLGVGQSEVFREVRMGYRLELLPWERVELGIEGTRHESKVGHMAPEHEIMLRLALQ